MPAMEALVTYKTGGTGISQMLVMLICPKEPMIGI